MRPALAARPDDDSGSPAAKVGVVVVVAAVAVVVEALDTLLAGGGPCNDDDDDDNDNDAAATEAVGARNESSNSQSSSSSSSSLPSFVGWLLPKLLKGAPQQSVHDEPNTQSSAKAQRQYNPLVASISDVAAHKNARWGWRGDKMQESTDGNQSKPGEGDGGGDGGMDEFLATSFELMDRFLRSPPIGEFHQRLALVSAFYHQQYARACAAHTEASRLFLHQSASVVFNVLQYYRQFAAAVARRIEQSRAPLEKKLRDHARLSRWDDRTYYSLYESSEKAHRTVHKIVLDYREALSMPVHALLDELLNVPCDGAASPAAVARVFDSAYASVQSNSVAAPLESETVQAQAGAPAGVGAGAGNDVGGSVVRQRGPHPELLLSGAWAAAAPGVAARLRASRFAKVASIRSRMVRMLTNPAGSSVVSSSSGGGGGDKEHGPRRPSSSVLLASQADQIDQFTSSVISRWERASSPEVCE